MNSVLLPGLSPFQAFRRLPSTVRRPFFSWSAGPNGWKTTLAVDPVDELVLYPHDSIDRLYQFCREHTGRFLSGYLSFELGYELLELKTTRALDPTVPLAQFNAYDNYLLFENGRTNCFYRNPKFPEFCNDLSDSDNSEKVKHSVFPFKASLDELAYGKQFGKIINHIKAGDIYQINYTHQLEGRAELTGRQLFEHFARSNPVDYAAYWETDGQNIISLSPESFVQIKNGTIVTKPIKGTRPRGETAAEDSRLQAELLASRKEQAELFMITDLLRNDVGKVSRIGSVKVVHQKKLQKLPRVFHTYSRVEGQQRPDITGIEVLVSMFPGGSITGCPKRKAVEIIGQIEDQPRGVYTGTVGYILPDGEMAFNIAIRTVIQRGNALSLGVGGGITIESDVVEEYHETFAKARSF